VTNMWRHIDSTDLSWITLKYYILINTRLKASSSLSYWPPRHTRLLLFSTQLPMSPHATGAVQGAGAASCLSQTIVLALVV
jgi:hypothetical protein